MMNAMLISSGVSQNLWGDVILSGNYLLNKVLRKDSDKYPYEFWTRSKPSYKYLRMWGCLAKVAIRPPKAVKIGPKTVNCVFIGYAHNSFAYRFIVHRSTVNDIHNHTIMESRMHNFLKMCFLARLLVLRIQLNELETQVSMRVQIIKMRKR